MSINNVKTAFNREITFKMSLSLWIICGTVALMAFFFMVTKKELKFGRYICAKSQNLFEQSVNREITLCSNSRCSNEHKVFIYLLAVIFYIRRKSSICVMYQYLLINKTQTQLKIYWRSDHFYCIKTQQTTSYYK